MTRKNKQRLIWIPIMGAIPVMTRTSWQDRFFSKKYTAWHVGWAVLFLSAWILFLAIKCLALK
jgi:hypothetical protein